MKQTADRKMEWTEAIVVGDWDEIPRQAEIASVRWNGFVCPRFERAEAERIVSDQATMVAAFPDTPSLTWENLEGVDVIVQRDPLYPDEPQTYFPDRNERGELTWAIGAWAWVWSEAPKCPRCENYLVDTNETPYVELTIEEHRLATGCLGIAPEDGMTIDDPTLDDTGRFTLEEARALRLDVQIPASLFVTTNGLGEVVDVAVSPSEASAGYMGGRQSDDFWDAVGAWLTDAEVVVDDAPTAPDGEPRFALRWEG